MPQMSPMLWSLLFIYFISLFLIFNALNYFNFIPSISSTPTNQNLNSSLKTSMNWKW